MAQAVDLSQFKRDPSFEDLPKDVQEKLAAQAEKNGVEPEPTKVQTAFLVLIDTNGTTFVSTDLTMALEPDHSPSPDEVFTAASVILKNIQVQETASLVTGLLNQIASRAQQEAQAQAIRNKLKL